VVQQLFHAFINRTDAYDKAHAVGLITFGKTVSEACRLTPYFDQFQTKLDNIRPDGDTPAYDALDLARQKLDTFAETNPKAIKRIFLLTDGLDTSSEIDALTVTTVH
jgi:Mg-chelatase subunit ChlD